MFEYTINEILDDADDYKAPKKYKYANGADEDDDQGDEVIWGGSEPDGQ